MTPTSGVEFRPRQYRALLLACAQFTDPKLPPLRSPSRDAELLARVLSDPAGSRYTVIPEIDRTSQQARIAVERFFAAARPDDVSLLYFSCHGIQDPRGDLYFAFTDTRRELLGATAVSAEWVRARMQESRCQTSIVLVDCCFSGAFLRGMRSRSSIEANVGALVRDLPEGSGVAVLTASGETEYSMEEANDRAAAAVRPSYFTEAVVTGIGTGAADLDGDGRITVEELYQYVYRRVVAGPSPQRPRKMGHGEGQVTVARVNRRLPDEPIPPGQPERDVTMVIEAGKSLPPWPPPSAVTGLSVAQGGESVLLKTVRGSERRLTVRVLIGALVLAVAAVAVYFTLSENGSPRIPRHSPSVSPTFSVNSCVRQSGGKAVPVSCSTSGAYRIVAKVDAVNKCPEANQPFVFVSESGKPNQVLCLKPVS
jgi:hypothetical protein